MPIVNESKRVKGVNNNTPNKQIAIDREYYYRLNHTRFKSPYFGAKYQLRVIPVRTLNGIQDVFVDNRGTIKQGGHTYSKLYIYSNKNRNHPIKGAYARAVDSWDNNTSPIKALLNSGIGYALAPAAQAVYDCIKGALDISKNPTKASNYLVMLPVMGYAAKAPLKRGVEVAMRTSNNANPIKGIVYNMHKASPKKHAEPNNYSVHFKTDRNGLSYGNKMQLFAKVADKVPEGANLSTWGYVSKGGIHGINRFGKDFGFIQNGTRQLTLKGTKEPIKIGIFQKPKLDQGMVRLYRASGTNGKFTPSPDGTAKYAGMWFTDNPRKTLTYASYTRRKAIKEGVDNPIELQYIDIPKTQLNQYKASNIIGNDPNIDYEINEDFLIPLNMKRNRIPLKGITGNILRDSRLTIPELDPNVFKIAAPIGMSLPFLNNSQK